MAKGKKRAKKAPKAEITQADLDAAYRLGFHHGVVHGHNVYGPLNYTMGQLDERLKKGFN